MCRFSYASRTGLTLLELVVVLGILAMLSSVAIRSLGPIAINLVMSRRSDYSMNYVSPWRVIQLVNTWVTHLLSTV